MSPSIVSVPPLPSNVAEKRSIDPTWFGTVMQEARAMGFVGFGGACAHAAMAINAVLLNGQAQMVGCFNQAFQERGSLLGHVALRWDDPVYGEVYLDADGRFKGFDDVECWGMLDEHDLDHQEQARAQGFVLDDVTASEVATFEMDASDVLEHFGNDPHDLATVLRRAQEAWLLRHEGRGTAAARPHEPAGFPAKPRRGC